MSSAARMQNSSAAQQTTMITHTGTPSSSPYVPEAQHTASVHPVPAHGHTPASARSAQRDGA